MIRVRCSDGGLGHACVAWCLVSCGLWAGIDDSMEHLHQPVVHLSLAKIVITVLVRSSSSSGQ